MVIHSQRPTLSRELEKVDKAVQVSTECFFSYKSSRANPIRASAGGTDATNEISLYIIFFVTQVRYLQIVGNAS